MYYFVFFVIYLRLRFYTLYCDIWTLAFSPLSEKESIKTDHYVSYTESGRLHSQSATVQSSATGCEGNCLDSKVLQDCSDQSWVILLSIYCIICLTVEDFTVNQRLLKAVLPVVKVIVLILKFCRTVVIIHE